MENLRLYNQGRTVPGDALKAISAGRLKGMSDINPMWRIKRLTEMFGPCGIGWWYEITKKEIVRCEEAKEAAAFVDILLYYKDPVSGEESHGIPGTGGASFLANERNGPYMSDEAFKMALTDAISVAAKALGVAADVYYAKDRSKYTQTDDTSPAVPPAPAAPAAPPVVTGYDRAMEGAKAILATITDSATANQAAAKWKDIRHEGLSERDSAVLWNRKMKELNLFYDRVLKEYTVVK